MWQLTNWNLCTTFLQSSRIKNKNDILHSSTNFISPNCWICVVFSHNGIMYQLWQSNSKMFCLFQLFGLLLLYKWDYGIILLQYTKHPPVKSWFNGNTHFNCIGLSDTMVNRFDHRNVFTLNQVVPHNTDTSWLLAAKGQGWQYKPGIIIQVLGNMLTISIVILLSTCRDPSKRNRTVAWTWPHQHSLVLGYHWSHWTVVCKDKEILWWIRCIDIHWHYDQTNMHWHQIKWCHC